MGGGTAVAWEGAFTSAVLNLQLKTFMEIMYVYR